MNNGLANLVIGTSTREDGVTVTHLVRGVQFGKIIISYENGQPTRVERTESVKLGAAGGNVARLV
jgi:hypothetical protein